MTLRENIDSNKLMAHRILDMVKAGLFVEESWVTWALVILGDYA